MTMNEYTLVRFAAQGLSIWLTKDLINTMKGVRHKKLRLPEPSKNYRKAIDRLVEMAKELFLVDKRKRVTGIKKAARKMLEKKLKGKEKGLEKFMFDSLIESFEAHEKARKNLREDRVNSGRRSSDGGGMGRGSLNEEIAAAEHAERMEKDVAYRQEHEFWTKNDTRIGGS